MSTCGLCFCSPLPLMSPCADIKQISAAQFGKYYMLVIIICSSLYLIKVFNSRSVLHGLNLERSFGRAQNVILDEEI